MTAPMLTRVRPREREIELALDAMCWVMDDKSFPYAVRYAVAQAHSALHRCFKQRADRASAARSAS